MNTLLTGANGFLGRYIYMSLTNNGHAVSCLGRSISNDIVCNLANEIPQLISTNELVIHCSGKAHMIPINPVEEQEFFDVNVKGTQNLLSAVLNSATLPKFFVFISSVSVYGLEKGVFINEAADLKAKDPYGLSKIKAEKLIKDWCDENGVICTILRLPLLIGNSPKGNLKEMINGIRNGYYFNIGGGSSKKSMVYAKDVADVVLKAAQKGGIYNLTDRIHPTFLALSNSIALQLGKPKPQNIPMWLALILAKIGDLLGKKFPINSLKLKKITADLTFDDSLAVKNLEWNPSSVLQTDLKIKKL